MWQPTVSSDELYHHGILGQKWGVRRYQNPDGSLTSAGRKRYGANSVEEIRSRKGIERRLNDLDSAMARNKRKSIEAEQKFKKIQKKKESAAAKGNNRKVQKLGEKSLKFASEHAKSERNIQKGEKETNRLLQTAGIEGYDIKSQTVSRNVATGKDYAKLAAGILMMPIPIANWGGESLIGDTLSKSRVAGAKKYKVKEPKYKYDYQKNSDGSTDVGIYRKDGKGMSEREVDRMSANVKDKYNKLNKKKNTYNLPKSIANKVTDMTLNGASEKEIKEYLKRQGY